MPIIDLQRSFSEVGRIRIGQQVAAGRGTRPAKLETFRLTSPDKKRIEAAQQLYGGKVEEWQAPSGKQWQTITDVDVLPVLVPPVADMAFTQWMELWSAAGCQRRCDTATESISEGPCLCDPAVRECTPHSRLSVLLPEVPGLGVWRLDSQGFNAARELLTAVNNIIQIYDSRGDLLPAQLRLDQRVLKRPGEQTKRFAVPMLDITATPAELLYNRRTQAALPQGFQYNTIDDLLASGDPELAVLEAANERVEVEQQRRSHLTAIPQTGGPPPSIAEQTAVVDNLQGPKRRSRASIGGTAIAPRTAEQAERDDQPPPPPDDATNEPVEHAERNITSNTRIPDNGDYSKRVEDSNVEQTDLLSEADVVELILPDQLRRLGDLLKEAGFSDIPSRRRYVNTVIGRHVNNAEHLTKQEGEHAIDKLQSRLILVTQLKQAGFVEADTQIAFVQAAVKRDVTDNDCWNDLSDTELRQVMEILDADTSARDTTPEGDH